DKGCVFVGCTRPAEWTQAHHIRHWIDLGPTDIANLCLLCAEHHRLIHHSEWDIIMTPDGHPECVPPKFIDPQQTPRRNYAHHHHL
ncbi:MAG: HNH endonuclease, partial [Actinophytocola sp.]|nr:HNH endonuclease [Actinophytocola sp.]